MDERSAQAATSPCRVRRRDAGDLDECVRVLAEVHGSDGYPMNWPRHPGEWLTRPAQLAAWVAEVDGRVIGHVGLSRSGSEDVAAVLWSRQKGVPLKDTAVVGRLFVSPAARGLGAGALMMADGTPRALGQRPASPQEPAPVRASS